MLLNLNRNLLVKILSESGSEVKRAHLAVVVSKNPIRARACYHLVSQLISLEYLAGCAFETPQVFLAYCKRRLKRKETCWLEPANFESLLLPKCPLWVPWLSSDSSYNKEIHARLLIVERAYFMKRPTRVQAPTIQGRCFLPVLKYFSKSWVLSMNNF